MAQACLNNDTLYRDMITLSGILRSHYNYNKILTATVNLLLFRGKDKTFDQLASGLRKDWLKGSTSLQTSIDSLHTYLNDAMDPLILDPLIAQADEALQQHLIARIPSSGYNPTSPLGVLNKMLGEKYVCKTEYNEDCVYFFGNLKARDQSQITQLFQKHCEQSSNNSCFELDNQRYLHLAVKEFITAQLNALLPTKKDNVYRIIRIIADRPPTDKQWAQEHACDDLSLLADAITSQLGYTK